MDARDTSILTQVAFKAAVEAGDDVTTDEGAAAFEARFSYYTESLMTAVQSNQGRNPAPSINAAIVNTPPATGAVPAGLAEMAAPSQGATVRVIGDSHGPLPDWLIAACARDGVDAVYDKRDKVQANPKHPWFKSASKFPTKDGGQDYKPYWPPKGK